MNKKELRQLSKSQLIVIIQSQQEIIDNHDKRIKELEHLLKSFDNPHTQSSKKRKKNTEKDEDKPRFPGKPPGSGGGGIKLPPPDEVVEHKLDACPDCHNTNLGNPVRKEKKTVIDFPEKLVVTTENRIDYYFCTNCNKEVTAPVELPDGIYGKRVQSVITMLKNSTLSHDKISDFLKALGFPTLSSPTTLNIIQRMVQKLQRTRDELLASLRQSPFLHADETGLRRDGRNSYVWGVFSNTIAILSAELSRARENIRKLLPNYGGVIVTDGFNAYDEFPIRQRCWSHLLREFKDYAKKNDEIKVQYTRIKKLYEQMKELNAEPPDEVKIEQVKFVLQDIVTCLNAIKQGRKLATLIQNGGEDWFTALYHPGVPLENNHAERGLRHIVLHRKAMGCYRTDKGKNWIDIGISVLQSWRLQGKNVYQELCAVAMT